MGSSIGITRRNLDTIRSLSANTNIYVSTTGSDTNVGTRISSPFRTIEKAITFLNEYYIPENFKVNIILSEGTYTITSELLFDHPQGKQITLKGSVFKTSEAKRITDYTDTTSRLGKVDGRLYQKVFKDYNGDLVPDKKGLRYDMTIDYDGQFGVTPKSSDTGKYIIVSPFDSNYEIQTNLNSDSLANGNLFDNTDVKRYSETESTMQRFFAFGGHVIKYNLLDFGSEPIVENRVKNVNAFGPQTSTDNFSPILNREHNLSTPESVGTDFPATGYESVSTRYIGAVIKMNSDATAIRIKNSALTLSDVAIETTEPLGTLETSTSSGVVVEDGSTLTLGQGVVIRNFETGIHVKEKSNLIQSNSSINQYQSVTSCGTGVLIDTNSQATLQGFVVNGCWFDGFVVNNQSSGSFNSCIAVGNGSSGFLATRNSNLITVRCVSCYNIQTASPTFNENSEGGIGFGCRLNSNGEFSGCLSFRNGFGYFADKCSSINVTSSDSTDSLNRGVSVSEGSSAIIGPFYKSLADGNGIYLSDSSFVRAYDINIESSGFDAPTGLQGSGVVIATNSTLNLQNSVIKDYSNNALQAVYGSNVVGDNITVTENTSTIGDSIHSTYSSIVRVLGSELGTGSTIKSSLLGGYIEVNGAEI